MKHRTFFFLLVISSLSIQAHCENVKRFIAVDVANVRDKPNQKSDVLFKLHINLPVLEIKRVTEWVYISYNSIASGWVHQNSLGNNSLTEKELRDSIVFANEVNGKIKWAERLIAAYPRNDTNWNILEKHYESKHDTDGVKSVQERFSGKNAYIAMDFFGTRILLGKLDSQGDFKSFACPLVDSQYTCEHIAKTKPLVTAATGKRWYSLEGEAPEGAFVLAKKGPNKKWKEKIRKNMEVLANYLEGYDTPVQWYEFGTGDSNRIFSTHPIVNASRDVKLNSSLSVLSIPDQLFHSDSIRHLPRDHDIMIKPYYDIGFYEAISNFNYGDKGPMVGVYGYEFTGIFNEGGKKIFPTSPVSPLIYGGETKGRFGLLSFFSFQYDEQRNIYGIYTYDIGSQDGGVMYFDLIRISQKGEVKSYNIFQNYSGG